MEITHQGQRQVVEDVLNERARQDGQWGQQDHHGLVWLGILVEEVGEYAQALIESGPRPDPPALKRTRAELIQIAAVAIAAAESMDRKAHQKAFDQPCYTR